MLATPLVRGPKGRINIRIAHSGSKAQYKGNTIIFCRILVLVWSLQALLVSSHRPPSEGLTNSKQASGVADTPRMYGF